MVVMSADLIGHPFVEVSRPGWDDFCGHVDPESQGDDAPCGWGRQDHESTHTDDGPHEEGSIRCQVCKAHPGWAHGDESARSEPLDVCKACLGSGTREVLFTEVSASLLFSLARRYTNDATDAGKDEAERDMRLAVLRLANVAAALQYLVTNW